MKKLLIGIGKKSKKAFSNQVDVKKKNKVLKDYCILINKNKERILKENNKDVKNAYKKKIEQNILQAIQKAHELSTTTMKERMNDLTGGLNLNLPGFDNNDS